MRQFFFIFLTFYQNIFREAILFVKLGYLGENCRCLFKRVSMEQLKETTKQKLCGWVTNEAPVSAY